MTALVAEQLVQLLTRERQERREDRLQRVDDAERDEQDRRRALAVFLDDGPRRLMVDVLVPDAREPHRLGERLLELPFFDRPAYGRKTGLDGRESPAVLIGELAGLRHFSEVALRVRERAVDEVAPVREQLVVVAPQELRPREVAVLRLGPCGGEEVANGIRVVALEHVADVDRD